MFHITFSSLCKAFLSPEAAILLVSTKNRDVCLDPIFLSMCRGLMMYFKPIRFARFENESVNRGLPVLELAVGLDPWC